MSERKEGKSSKINPATPAGPVVSWDFNQLGRPGQVLRSESPIMVWGFHGRSWDQRGVMKGTLASAAETPLPRRQMFKPKIPHGNGSR